VVCLLLGERVSQIAAVGLLEDVFCGLEQSSVRILRSSRFIILHRPLMGKKAPDSSKSILEKMILLPQQHAFC